VFAQSHRDASRPDLARCSLLPPGTTGHTRWASLRSCPFCHRSTHHSFWGRGWHIPSPQPQRPGPELLTSGVLLTPAFLHLLRTVSALPEHRTPEVTADTLIPPMALPMLLISVPSWAVAAPTGCPPSPLRTVPRRRVPRLLISRPATILSHSALSSAKATVDRNRRCLHSQFDTPFAARLGSLLAPPSLPPSHHRTGDTARHSLLPMPLPLAFRKRCFLSPSLQSLFKG